MGEAQLRLGDQSSADIKLFLTGPNEEQYGRNPVHLHSQILKRSKFFEDNYSKRWSSDKPTDIWVTTSHSFDHYLKCLELMYGEDVCFSNIEECLAILSVASEMLADDCIDECMQYLEAVRWSAQQESQIQSVLSCLGLKVLPDLAARLHQEDDDHTILLEKGIQEMLSLIKDSSSNLSKNRETASKYLAGTLEGNTSRDVVEVCGRVVLQEFKASIDSRNFSTLWLLFKLIQHCKGRILKAALKAFCEDAGLAECVKHSVKEQQHQATQHHSPQFFGMTPVTQRYDDQQIVDHVFDIIMWFMKATGDGKIIISRASRVSLLTTWLPITETLCYNDRLRKLGELDKAVLNVVESLPLADKKRICVVWAELYRSKSIDISTPLTLFKDLQHAHSKSAAN